MKICYFNDYRLGVVKGDQVVDITDAVKDVPHHHRADIIIGLINLALVALGDDLP